MRVGEIGHGELSLLCVARIAVRGEPLGPVPNSVAERRFLTQFVVETELGDTVNLAQALGELELRMVFDAPLEGRNDFALRKPGAARTAHCKHERKAEFRAIVGVEPADFRDVIGAALLKARRALLSR